MLNGYKQKAIAFEKNLNDFEAQRKLLSSKLDSKILEIRKIENEISDLQEIRKNIEKELDSVLDQVKLRIKNSFN